MEDLILKLKKALNQGILFILSKSSNKDNKKWLTLNPLIQLHDNLDSWDDIKDDLESNFFDKISL
jgi:hypothetical protein